MNSLAFLFSRRIAGLIASSAILAAGLAVALLISGCGRRREAPPPDITWLSSSDGERCGVVVTSDLRADFAAWDLIGPRQGGPALNSLGQLARMALARGSGVAINGGFWNENDHPVGVCAGARGIYHSITHPAGMALAGGRAWIGPLDPYVSLATLGETTEPLMLNGRAGLAINPYPLPRQNACLIDPATYPWPLEAGPTADWWWLEPEKPGPLRFNAQRRVRVTQKAEQNAGRGEAIPANIFLLFVPRPLPGASGADPLPVPDSPAVGQTLLLNLTLGGVQGEVRLATCAGPRLLRNGVMVEGLDPRRDVRTTIGTDAVGRHLWLLLLARGAQGQTGATLAEAAQALLKLGATEALNLDGGSSTSIWAEPQQPELDVLFPASAPIHHALVLRSTLTKKASQP